MPKKIVGALLIQCSMPSAVLTYLVKTKDFIPTNIFDIGCMIVNGPKKPFLILY